MEDQIFCIECGCSLDTGCECDPFCDYCVEPEEDDEDDELGEEE